MVNLPAEPCFYPFPEPLQPGILVRRYKRFFADITLSSGETITAHCPNTGPMSGVCAVGSPVWVSYHADPKRKLAYTWEVIQVGETLVGVNTALPNRIMDFGFHHGWFPEWRDAVMIQREVPYGQSRLDFRLTLAAGEQVYVEIKNTTWCQGSLALFPDTVTTRGQKHLHELISLVNSGQRGALVYFIHRGDCDRFAPGDRWDPLYGQLLRQAVGEGVEILPYRFDVTPEGVTFVGRASLCLNTARS